MKARQETRIKKWNRAWKIELIETINRDWRNLHGEIDVTATLVAGTREPRFMTLSKIVNINLKLLD